MGNPGDGEESHPEAKNLLIYPTRKTPHNEFSSSAIKSVIPSPSDSNFHLFTLYIQASFVAVAIAIISLFNWLYEHMYYANFV